MQGNIEPIQGSDLARLDRMGKEDAIVARAEADIDADELDRWMDENDALLLPGSGRKAEISPTRRSRGR